MDLAVVPGHFRPVRGAGPCAGGGSVVRPLTSGKGPVRRGVSFEGVSERTERLRADCEGCVGLCCVALPFTASSDFAVGKAAGEPCRNLTQDHRCGIHDRLRESGFSGCVVFDCYGAGQRVTARQDVPAGPGMFAVFRVTRQLH